MARVSIFSKDEIIQATELRNCANTADELQRALRTRTEASLEYFSFQNEARYGQMNDSRACWAPAPLCPVVPLALVREFACEYAAVSPLDGAFDFMTMDKLNAESNNRFLDQSWNAHPDDFLGMILDLAQSHKDKGLNIPEKIRLIHLHLPSGAESGGSALEYSSPGLFRKSCL